MHFWAGYVPPHHPVEVFAQALRAIGEPIHGRTADEISMADLLGQLFAFTEVFDMQTRPELILLQKSMVIVEGVARSLDPSLNMWAAAEPVAKEWVAANYGARGAVRKAGEGATTLARVLAEVPAMLAGSRARVSRSFGDGAGGAAARSGNHRCDRPGVGPARSVDARCNLDRRAQPRSTGCEVRGWL